ncbi:MAG: glycerophosphodiester phosphodiesterase family protein [Blastocatellia bacterium]
MRLTPLRPAPFIAGALFLLLIATAQEPARVLAPYQKKTLVAHRGASGYAPEHTLAAYRLALAQGADYVEQDLQISKDGVLVCLHDLTLERTTNVAEVFPDRFKLENGEKHWHVADFTLAEIRRLDAGSWFDKKYKGQKVPTFQEAIDLVRGKAGIFPETKGPEVYGSRGLDMERLVLAALQKNKLDDSAKNKSTPVIIQSFSPESLRKMKQELKIKVPLVLLIEPNDGPQWLTREGLQKARAIADGIGPHKRLLDGKPEIVRLAHEMGFSVTPWTFRVKGEKGRFPDVRAEMRYYLDEIGVDALFTDNPDQFPRDKK